MKVEKDTVISDTEITEQITMLGSYLGEVTVKENGFLLLHGIAHKNITVEPEGKLEVAGLVEGDVFNLGGDICIKGIVVGDVKTYTGGTTVSRCASVAEPHHTPYDKNLDFPLADGEELSPAS